MAVSIFDQISEKAEYLTEDDIDSWILPSVMDAYESKLKFLSFKANGEVSDSAQLASRAFREFAKQELRDAIFTFIFKKEHWRDGRDIDPYLRLSLNRLAQRKYWETNAIKLKSAPVCPLCREMGVKKVLQKEEKLLRCNNCTDNAARLFDEIKLKKGDIYLQCKYNAHSKFALHSKLGYKCPECSKFIPDSLSKDGKIHCPYDNCLFVGDVVDLTVCAHPTVTFGDRSAGSKVQTISGLQKSDDDFTSSKMILAFKDTSASADALYDVKNQFENELKVLNEVIESQIKKVKRTNGKSTVTQKIIMYKAFQKMIKNYPIEMVSYLVHKEQKSSFPIQARIFQTYATLIENHMPITIIKKGKEVEIFDLTDPDLSLFNGISEFEAEIKENKTIPNKTKEEYIGGRNFKNYGPCFIGKLIDVIDVENNKSIKKDVVEYSFSKITMNDNVTAGSKVKVKHYRILSHYEMDSLVFLQRIRKDIVNSVHLRLNKRG